ncbi:MAG: asparagine synthase [Thermoleophilia bacterium]|nr:asparagine synthase [Thermoleophilia bacterium]
MIALDGETGALGPGAVRAQGLVVALDGRIFNRDELPAAASDAECVAALWRAHGPAGALARLNADIAVAVWDPSTRELWLGRDRFGLRPLYHAATRTGHAFASRPRPLLARPGVGREVDPGILSRLAASHYRTFDDAPDRSPYRDVAQVPAAHVVRIAGGDVRAERYWSPSPAEPEGSPAELAERLRALLMDAVERRVRLAPNPAFTLSGGMDSSSVVACAARALGGPQPAFSTVYRDPTYDERDEIADMLGERAGPWHPVELDDSPDVVGIVAGMVAEQDEPVATATWLSHRLLADRCRELGFGSLLGGLGGDELNAGEYEYFPALFADLRAAGRETELGAEIAAWAAHHDHPIHRKDRAVAEAMMDRLIDPSGPGRILPDRARIERYAAALGPAMPALADFAPTMEHPFASALSNRAWQDLTRETLPCCLRAESRTMAAVGMERFHPFLDHRLVELMLPLRGDLKIRAGTTKQLLREAMRGVLPEATRTRVAKTGWNAPAHRWFTGAGREALMDLVRSQPFRERGVYDPAEVERLAAEHEAIVLSGEPRDNHMMFLWQVLNVELWLRDLEGAGT